jgi:hypothetical protein
VDESFSTFPRRMRSSYRKSVEMQTEYSTSA